MNNKPFGPFLAILFAIINLQCIFIAYSLKLGSYNTYQSPSNPLASSFLEAQIEQVGQSDIDILCLQEMNLAATTSGYIDALTAFGYTNSLSMLDVITDISPNDLETPRTPCNQQEVINALTSTCSRTYCEQFYNELKDVIAFAICLATACPDDFNIVQYGECIPCTAIFTDIQPNLGGLYPFTLDGAISFCSNPPTVFSDILFNFTDGNVIITKQEFPIINTWSFEIPSWLFIPKRLHIAEINICSETDPNNKSIRCNDSIIIGCTHLEPLDYIKDNNIVQSPRLSDDNITSHVGLNRYQTEYILDNVFNDNILETLGRENNAENIFGVFLLGDLNNGQLFNRCDWTDKNGENAADNCDDENSSNPFDLWTIGGLIDAPDIIHDIHDIHDIHIECTFCLDESSDDFNILAQKSNADDS